MWCSMANILVSGSTEPKTVNTKIADNFKKMNDKNLALSTENTHLNSVLLQQQLVIAELNKKLANRGLVQAPVVQSFDRDEMWHLKNELAIKEAYAKHNQGSRVSDPLPCGIDLFCWPLLLTLATQLRRPLLSTMSCSTF